jgi:phenylalanyl-tRNA synthetase beta chain
LKVPLGWLREFVDFRVEPRRLAEDLTLAGLAVDGVESAGSEVVLDLDITTNRVDCMNVYGVAREVAVLYSLPLRPPDVTFPEGGPVGDALDVQIEDPDLCPRFCARVLDVRVAPSPRWLTERLELVGVRPINNVVDLSNYAMIELGHPSHAFDLGRIAGGRLIVRWAREGERLVTLDGVERALTPRIGVVAAGEGPLALAGIMGGASSEVSDETRTVALEAAYWEPLAIRRAAKGLGMHTEASHRFERGADPDGAAPVTARIAHLLHKIGAGATRAGLIDRYPAPRPARTVVYRQAKADALLGTTVPPDAAERILTGLGFTIARSTAGVSELKVPTWRGDVSREADVIEEVGRHHGLTRIAPTIPPSRGAEGLRPWQQRERAVRELLVGAGLVEVIHYTFVSNAAADASLPPRVPIANPLSDEQDVLRNSLVSPGLLACLETNLRQGRRDVAVFELGRVFLAGERAPREERRLGILLAGAWRPAHWSRKPAAADFFDVKGLLEALWRRLGLSGPEFAREDVPALLHPGRGAAVTHEGRLLGYAGALHPGLIRSRDLRLEPIVAEIDVEPLLLAVAAPERSEPLERFPAVLRDLSILCDPALGYGEIAARIRVAAGPQLRSVTLSDRYQGPQVPEGKVSLTVTLRYQEPSRTLTGEEIQASVARVVGDLRLAGADIRGE